MLFMETRHYHIIIDILSRYPYTFYAFGSRTKGNPKKFSDLDLCYKEPIPSNVINELEEAFEESYLPFTVDLLNWNTCSSEFRDIIKNDLIQLPHTPQA
ncbi:MAG: uncharacterized protein QG604_695 [Candidatus Dependentiae bacterium]|nr:uncharacterized protein [Candidatus Dependentiae bacterium]